MKYSAPALALGLEIVQIIAQEEEIGFSSIQKLTGINTNSLSRYLSTLGELGYITKNNNGKYRADLQLFLLNQESGIFHEMRKSARPYLRQLRDEFDVCTMLFAVSKDNLYCIEKVMSSSNPIFFGQTELYNPTNLAYAWGMLFLAQMSDEQIDEFMNTHHKEDYEPASKNLFYNAVHFTRETGYCDDKLTSPSGIRKIAVPVYWKETLIGVLAATGFALLLDDEKAIGLTNRLQEYAEKIL